MASTSTVARAAAVAAHRPLAQAPELLRPRPSLESVPSNDHRRVDAPYPDAVGRRGCRAVGSVEDPGKGSDPGARGCRSRRDRERREGEDREPGAVDRPREAADEGARGTEPGNG